jgi:NlpC/P60 family putative phage cell wall peptidase
MPITTRQHREDIVAATRSWLGTPYHHQASERGLGADCIGLVRGVWRDIYGFDAELPSAYSRDWAEASGDETLLAAAARHLVSIESSAMSPGDVVVFRLRAGLIAKHAAILVTPQSFIHAMEGAAACEVPMSSWWRRRLAGTFAFPGVTN